jgi:hypothetical protein
MRKHTTSTLRLLRTHNESRIFREALDVFLVQGLCIAGTVEVFHECDESGAAGRCPGSIICDLVGHFGRFGLDYAFFKSCRFQLMILALEMCEEREEKGTSSWVLVAGLSIS